MPMSREQFLLLKLAEECAEVAQMCSKCMQFGLEETYQIETNKERLHKELVDVLAVVSMLNTDSNFDFQPSVEAMEAMEEKCAKIDKYYKYSVKLGKVEDLA
jgi:NTP pyrophosphatase (non-canonical NTP hydrolase)